MNSDIGVSLQKGLAFLGDTQEKNGSFLCLVSTKLDDYKKAKTVPAIVPTNIVLSSLIHIPGKISEKIKKKAANFLLKEKGEYWSFNYWFRKSDWFKIEPYPDDVDDTFCALAALYEYNPALFNGEVMAKIATMLTSAEKQEGGPYDMWLVPEEGRKIWNDTDLVVNSNVTYFLSLQDISLTNLTAFIEKKIDEGGYEFPYNKIYPGIYFISRFYKGSKTKKMIDLLLKEQKPDGKWENPLRTALAISSLINFGNSETGNKHYSQLEKGISYLINIQNKNGSWPAFSFYFQMRTRAKTLYAGSPSTTTALCLEALAKFDSLAKINSAVTDSKANKIYEAIAKKVSRRFSGCDPDLKREALKVITKTFKGDKDKQIALLPYYFRSSLGKLGNKISDEMTIKLGTANVLGWIAYTIYDDFLDDEGNTRLLSVANVALRESSEILGRILPQRSDFPAFSKKIFDKIDGANAWEMANCRLDSRNLEVNAMPNYGLPGQGAYSQLAMKSFGHALGPIAILHCLGYRENSAEVKNIISFFENYIIARQLDDDAHDWEDDLKKGHLNAIGVEILKDIRPRGNSMETKSLKRSLKKLQQVFWEKTIIDMAKIISRHTRLARQSLEKTSIIKKRKILESLVIAIESSVKKALKEREESIKFIETYKPR